MSGGAIKLSVLNTISAVLENPCGLDSTNQTKDHERPSHSLLRSQVLSTPVAGAWTGVCQGDIEIMDNPKVACKERRCDWHGLMSETLCALHPFDLSCNIYGCPKCKTIQNFTVCCDESGCWKQVCAGTPTKDGYRQTCHEHMLKL